MELTEISSRQLLKTVEERKTDTKNKIRHGRAKLEKNYVNVNLKKQLVVWIFSRLCRNMMWARFCPERTAEIEKWELFFGID